MEGTETLGDLPRGLGADLMAGAAAHLVEPIGLALHSFRNAVALGARAGELALVWHFGQRIPVAGWIVFRRRARVGRRHSGQVQNLARAGLYLRRIDQPVAAHPHVVGRFRKIRYHVAAPIVGDHDPGEFGGQVSRFCDNPDARLGPSRAVHNPAKVVVVDSDGFARELEGTNSDQRGDQEDREANAGRSLRQRSFPHIVRPPPISGPTTHPKTEIVNATERCPPSGRKPWHAKSSATAEPDQSPRRGHRPHSTDRFFRRSSAVPGPAAEHRSAKAPVHPSGLLQRSSEVTPREGW